MCLVCLQLPALFSFPDDLYIQWFISMLSMVLFFIVVAFLYNTPMLEVLGKKAWCLFQCKYLLTPELFDLFYISPTSNFCSTDLCLGYWVSWWCELGSSCGPSVSTLSQCSSQHAGFSIF